jgi:hypothetical protein
MNISRVNKAAGMILEYISSIKLALDTEIEVAPLTPDEKIAVLDTASSTIKSVLGAEMLKVAFSQILNNQVK